LLKTYNRPTRRRRGRIGIVGAVLVAFTISCTTPSTNVENSVQVGKDDEVIKLGMIAALIPPDLAGVLLDFSVAPKVGQALVDEINETGGLQGKKIEWVDQAVGVDAMLSPDAARKPCLAMTQEDKAFAVILSPGLTADVVRCLAVENHTLTMTMSSWGKPLYDDAEGRLFAGGINVSIGAERSYAGWPSLLEKAGALTKASKVGIIRDDTAESQSANDNGLKPALQKEGYDVVAEAVLPCDPSGQSCTQQAVAIQKLKDAGADFVFITAAPVMVPQLLTEAQNVKFDPQWTVAGLSATNSAAKLEGAVRDAYDGAWGLSQQFKDSTPAADECREIIKRRTGIEVKGVTDSDAFAIVTCLMVKLVADGIKKIDGPITQGAVIKQLEAMSEVPSYTGRPGSFGPGKHDAGDYQFISKFDKTTLTFVDIDPTPVKAPSL
jgi:ABC-type branched-subunit amino acid transport system substrate-binding protein